MAAISDGAAGKLLLTNFATPGDDLGWHVVNDDVMGGRSQGGFSIEQDTLRFSGRTNTNGGGFSSIRTKPLQLDLSEHDGIELRVKGDGRRYTWRLTTDATYRGYAVAYWADFDTVDGKWLTIRIPFAKFVPRVRGAQLSGPDLDAARVSGMGLMIYDKLDGTFALSLDSVHGYAGPAPPQ